MHSLFMDFDHFQQKHITVASHHFWFQHKSKFEILLQAPVIINSLSDFDKPSLFPKSHLM